MSFRDLAAAVGMNSASVRDQCPTKGDLAGDGDSVSAEVGAGAGGD